ncbi:MAG: hypothetical protein IPK13_13845 [Deltaproteobacteria bacterium]|nr:hypothetical protein [Deltaproteobacteria bacterium]
MVLSRDQMTEVRQALHARIEEGLAHEGREIRAFPAFVSPPSVLDGQALVVDTGGTNMRAAVVSLTPGKAPAVLKGPVQDRLPVRGTHKLDGETFFAIQAKLAASLSPPKNLPVGYCFSYASKSEPSLDATLTHWTKGIDIPGVEGTRVGQRLCDALSSAGVDPSYVHVVNDTVACLLGGAVVHKGPTPSNVIGLIVGTGTNMAGFFSPKSAPKLAAFGPVGAMAINLESGNFTPPFALACDDAIDARSPNPGRQRFEKAVSGYYLPWLFAELMPNFVGFDPEQGSKALVDLRDLNDGSEASEVAGALLLRSAQLVAAGLAAVVDFYEGDEPITILSEGSLFWGDPQYASATKAALEALLGRTDRVRFERVADVNLIGSAVVALNRSVVER